MKPFSPGPEYGRPTACHVRAARQSCKRQRLVQAALAYSHDDRDPLGGAGDGRVKPARPVLAEGEGFVEQHDVVPLRALRLVDGEGVAVGELVGFTPNEP